MISTYYLYTIVDKFSSDSDRKCVCTILQSFKTTYSIASYWLLIIFPIRFMAREMTRSAISNHKEVRGVFKVRDLERSVCLVFS